MKPIVFLCALHCLGRVCLDFSIEDELQTETDSFCKHNCDNLKANHGDGSISNVVIN